MTKRDYAVGAVALFICASANSAHGASSTECEKMAAEIAKDAGLIAGRRTQANFIPLSPRDGEFGAYLNCEGTFGLNLRFVSPPGAPQEWYQFVVRSASILTKAKPTIVREGLSSV